MSRQRLPRFLGWRLPERPGLLAATASSRRRTGRMASHTDRAPASPLPALLDQFFAAKTACDVDGTMSYFAPGMKAYIDATLGWEFDHGALKSVFEKYMPGWAPPARSYASKILAGPDSALVHMVDTPELFGGEIRFLTAVDFADGKIVRWVDYWDSSAFDTGLYTQFRTPDRDRPLPGTCPRAGSLRPLQPPPSRHRRRSWRRLRVDRGVAGQPASRHHSARA